MLGSLTAGLGLAAPFVIYGAALLVAAAVVFVSLRNSAVASPEVDYRTRCFGADGVRHRAYRAALFSNFATGWAAFGLRIALVPLFVVEALGYGAGFAGLALATFAIGNILAVIPSGYLSDRVGRRKLLIVGLTVSAISTVLVGYTSSLPVFLAAAFVTGAATGIFVSPQQAAVADIVGNKARGGTAVATFQMMADLGSIVGSLAVGQVAEHASFALGVPGQWRHPAGGRDRVGVRAGDTRPTADHADTDPGDRPRGRRRSAVTCDFEGFLQVV